MHERAAVAEAVAALLRETADEPIAGVTVELGPAMDRPASEDAWVAAVAGTAAEDAFVRWSVARDELRCFDCGQLFAGGRLTSCPRCGGDGLVVEQAPEVRVVAWQAAR